MPTIRDALHHGAARLQTAGIDNPRLEARLLLAHALGKDVAALLRDQGSATDEACYDALLSRRVAREPFALIVGHREFWSLDFAVSPATLIPRPDSETLIEAALIIMPGLDPGIRTSTGTTRDAGIRSGHNDEGKAVTSIASRTRAGQRPHPNAGRDMPGDDAGTGGARPSPHLASRSASPRRVLDLGTGTGCLLLAALSEYPVAFGVGVDRSPAAAHLAARNAAMLGMANRAAFMCGDWTAALGGTFDLILCNPPYIATDELTSLIPDVARYEPAAALDGGADGYAAYRSIIPDLPRLLAPQGIAVLEVGQGQAPTVASLAQQAGFTSVVQRDLSGIERALVLRQRPP